MTVCPWVTEHLNAPGGLNMDEFAEHVKNCEACRAAMQTILPHAAEIINHVLPPTPGTCKYCGNPASSSTAFTCLECRREQQSRGGKKSAEKNWERWREEGIPARSDESRRNHSAKIAQSNREKPRRKRK